MTSPIKNEIPTLVFDDPLKDFNPHQELEGAENKKSGPLCNAINTVAEKIRPGAEIALDLASWASGINPEELSALVGINGDFIVGGGVGVSAGLVISGDGTNGAFVTGEFGGGFDVDAGVSTLIFKTEHIEGVSLGLEVGAWYIDGFSVLSRQAEAPLVGVGAGASYSPLPGGASATIQHTTTTMCPKPE